MDTVPNPPDDRQPSAPPYRDRSPDAEADADGWRPLSGPDAPSAPAPPSRPPVVDTPTSRFAAPARPSVSSHDATSEMAAPSRPPVAGDGSTGGFASPGPVPGSPQAVPSQYPAPERPAVAPAGASGAAGVRPPGVDPYRFGSTTLPPQSPPPRPRPGPGPLASPSPGPHIAPPAEAPPPAPVEIDRRSTGRRSALAAAAVAFLLGGLVGAGGFAIGARSADDTTVAAAPEETVDVVNEMSTTTTPSIPETVTVPTRPPGGAVSAAEPAVEVARTLGPSVVQVETEIGQGSGVVYAEDLVMTNHHVIEGASTVRIRDADGRVFDVEVLGSDPRNDIAVLSVPDSGLPVAPVGSSAALEPGQVTVAIGSPFQLQQTVTAGIVSSINRPVPNADGSFTAMIQTDAPINPGNSGGALANVNGELVGINTAIRTDGTSNTNAGIGFAVPIDTALDVAARIVNGDSLDPAFLGVQGSFEDGDLGVPIAEVTAGSAAEAAGIQSGDRILTIDGIPVSDIQTLAGLIQSNFVGETVILEIQRGTETFAVEAQL